MEVLAPTSVKIDVDGTTVYWRAEYSGDTNYFGRVSNCQEYITATLQANTTAGRYGSVGLESERTTKQREAPETGPLSLA